MKEDCQNYIRTIVGTEEGKLLVCGTHAFAPACLWLSQDDIQKRIGGQFDGVGLAPYSPHYRHAYTMTRVRASLAPVSSG